MQVLQGQTGSVDNLRGVGEHFLPIVRGRAERKSRQTKLHGLVELSPNVQSNAGSWSFIRREGRGGRVVCGRKKERLACTLRRLFTLVDVRTFSVASVLRVWVLVVSSSWLFEP